MNEDSEINTVADVERPADIIFPNDPSLAAGSNIDRSDPENIRLLRKSLVYILAEKGVTLNRAQYRILRSLSDSYFFDAADRRNIDNLIKYLDGVEKITANLLAFERTIPSNFIRNIEEYRDDSLEDRGDGQRLDFIEGVRRINIKCKKMREIYKPRRGAPENKSVLILVEKVIKIIEIGSNSRFPKTVSRAPHGHSNASTNPTWPTIAKIVQAIDPTVTKAQIDTAIRKLPPSEFEPAPR